MPGRGRNRARAEVLWTAAGFVLIQLGLALTLERGLPQVRDEEFAAKLERLQARRAEMPGRPLAVVLGSSRTQMGLDAGWLSQDSGWLTFNLGFDGCGLMMECISLRRLLAAGIRPDLVVLEVIPVQLLVGAGCPVEDCRLHPTRFRADELAVVYPYSGQPWRLLTGWLRGRAFPCVQYHTQLRNCLGLDLPSDGNAVEDSEDIVDPWGWKPFRGAVTAERVAAATQKTLNEYRPELRDGRFGPEKLEALRALLAYCRSEHIPTAVVLMPESQAFQSLYPAGLQGDLVALLSGLQRDYELQAMIDARDWVGDNDFLDAHHLRAAGARAFTERFGREALPPLLGLARRDGSQTASASCGFNQTLP